MDQSILNIIHETVTEAHREVRTGRANAALRDAKTRADSEGQSQEATASQSNGANSETTKPSPSTVLRENPMKLTREEVCPNCSLPRLFDVPTNMSTEERQRYCGNAPPIVRSGHDVHGNAFLTDKPNNRGKKKQQPQQTQISAAPSPDSGSTSPPGTPATTSFTSAVLPEPVKPNTFPTIKCPNTKCTRYIAVRRMAAHIERCLFNEGRKAAKDAADKLDSRAGTPKPTILIGNKRAREDDSIANVKKKKLKATDGTPKKKASSQPSKLQNGESVDGEVSRATSPALKNDALYNAADSIKVDSPLKKFGGSAEKLKPPGDSGTAASDKSSKDVVGKSNNVNGLPKTKKDKAGGSSEQKT